MPLIFIHGVNTRRGPNYDADRHTRARLIQSCLLEPLSGGDANPMAIHEPYWGDLGVDFAWGLRSLPDARFYEYADGTRADGGLETPLSDERLALAGMILEAGGSESAVSDPRSSAGLLRLARANLPDAVDVLLSPIIMEEYPLDLPADATVSEEERARRRGEREALLLLAADAAARDPGLHASIEHAETDEQAESLIADEIRERYTLLLDASTASPDLSPPVPVAGGFESAAPPPWIAALDRRTRELFDRSNSRLVRTLSMTMLQARRRRVHTYAAHFLGDVFTYLNQRGTRENPGPIVEHLRRSIETARDSAPHEPQIVLTHSMGGNIFYDLLTHFAPDLSVDAWISVGGQVAQFEEMKLFMASDTAVGHPGRVAGLADRVGVWLNVYDPADVFSFMAEPVFQDAIDIRYRTGTDLSTAHGMYFRRPSFYQVVLEALRDRW